MQYEVLIRSVYNCGRGSAKGADADIYRRMDMAERIREDSISNKTQEEKDYDYRSKFSEVRANVRNALRDGLDKIKYRATKDDIEKIEEMYSTLHRLNFFDKKELDIIIESADEIFFKNGLTQ